MIHFRATGRAAYARTDEPLTTGSVGIPVDVSLSSDFDGLQAVVVFRSGDTSADVALLGQDVVVPSQVLTGRVLSMGVYASSTDGNTVIPTVWCDVGLIRGSVATEFDPAEPTPGWSAQIQAWAEDAADSATQAASVADSIRADMDEFNESSAIVLADAQAATAAANGAATNANTAASAANASASAADAATASVTTATGAANTAASAASDAAALATNAAGVATTAAGNADAATAAARQAAGDASAATFAANAAASAASAATTDTENATAAARQATADATTATAGANAAAATANTAADGANDAAGAANAAASAANTAANQATAAANNANSKANAANTAANNANAATSAANDATTRANAAIDAMGDISEQAVPVMSADVRGGAKIQPDSGLEITDTDNLQVRLALESEGDVRGGIAQVTAKGHAEQVSTTGKNLLPNNLTSQTVSGVEFTKQVDGGINVKGTSNASNSGLFIVNNLTLAAGTYTLSVGGTLASPMKLVLDSATSGSNYVSTIRSGSATFTLTSEDTVRLFFTESYSSATAQDTVIYPQIELGSTATDYEPYTGGAPSPSPDYPQEIQVVRGRNLCPYLEQGYWAFADGSSSVVSTWVRTPKIGCDPDMDYTATSEYVTGYIGFVWYDKNGSFISASTVGTTSQKKVLYSAKSPSNATYMAFNVQVTGGGSGIVPSDIKDLQINAGSTPQPYVPYGHVGMEMHGKNLTDVNTFENGSVVDTRATFQATLSMYDGSTFVKNVFMTNAGVGHHSMTFNVDNASYTYRFIHNGAQSNININYDIFAVEASVGAYVLSFDVISADPTVANGLRLKNIQLELGSTATVYQPYYHPTTTPIPLPQRGWVAGLRDGTADVLTLNGAGKCEWEMGTEEVVLDGSSDENWNLAAGDPHNAYITVQDMIAVKYDSVTPFSIMCDRFAFKGPYEPNRYIVSSVTIGPSSNKSALSINWHGIAESMTKEEWKTWLSTHPVTVLYPLATPVTEDCGYCEDWPTDIPEGAVITIPELDAVGVKYFIDSAVTELARQWHERIAYERTIATQDALASVAPTEHSPAESNHSVGELITYDGALYRVTAAIARGESITIGTNVTATTVAEQLAALQ